VVILRKGVNLYSGTVDGMLASHGFFELRAENQEALREFLENLPAVSRVEEENGLLTAYLKDPMDAVTMNRLCYENQIVLSHLVRRKESLEQQFLTITNHQDAQ
jgi:ABC-2 type transport system ATP-binding protein